jgi:eukaryotic-like serine/threonine-protein kinase
MARSENPSWDDESAPEILLDTSALAASGERATPLAAERFGKYFIVGELAMGGMAELFVGVQRGLEGFVKVVVIKRVLPQFSGMADFIRMFVDEARLAARLEHPNIVRTYEFGEVDGQYFTVMEYLPGEDLGKVLQRLGREKQQLPFAAAAAIVAQVCSGLHFAHELTDTAGEPLHLVHRDINPANIIITYSGEVKLIDFGVATTTQHVKTTAGTIKGKLAYMSPEHVLARGVDRRSDVFAVGIVLWELLAGRPLFVRPNEAATLYAIMNDPIPSIRRARPDVPPALEAIVMRALERTAIDRFETAAEMEQALDDFLAGAGAYDARARGRLLEELFGAQRAAAKRSIAQARSLATNVSLVMKLRSEARSDLAEIVDAFAGVDEAGGPVPAPASPEAGAPRLLLAGLALCVLAAIVGSLVFIAGSSGAGSAGRAAGATAAVRGSVVVESSPAGAAISVGGEPTGLKTPATLTGLTAPTVTVSLELLGHPPKIATIDVPPKGTTTEHFVFADASPSRLVIAELPENATILLDGEAHEAGTVIAMPPGRHDVRIVIGGRTVAEQNVEATAGDQIWKLAGARLERVAAP